jgi:gamma-glutamylputrescine oxidase
MALRCKEKAMCSTTAGWNDPQISFWHTGAPLSLVPDTLPPSADVVVVGGGLLGSCTTYWLARGGARVVLIERGAPAFGATGRNGGFHVVGTAEAYPAAIARHGHSAAQAVYQLTMDSRALLRAVLEGESIDCEYREPGRLNLALSPEDHTRQRETVAAMQADGFAAELLDRTQVQELVSTPLGAEIVGGLYVREDGLLQPARFVQGMLAAARRHGARICAAAVEALAADGDSVQVSTSAGTIRAGAAVVAVNAWTGQLLPALRETITPVRGQILSYAPIAPVFRAGMGAALTPTGEYWHQTPSGAIVLGGCRAIAPDGEVGLLAEGTHPGVQSAIEHVFPRLFPELRGLQVAQRWSGPMAFTRDYLPIADHVPEIERAWFVGGFCGHGMPFGMRLGQLLAEAATTGARPKALHSLRLDRPTL